MSHQAALDALGKMTRVFKAFEDAEVVLKALAGLEQNEKELRKAADAARADAAAATAELADAKETLAAAKKAATKVKNDAATEASRILKDAQEQAAKVHSDALAAVDVAEKALASVKESTVEAEARGVEAQSHLDKINAALTEARQRVATMME